MEKALHAMQPDVLPAAAETIDGTLNNQLPHTDAPIIAPLAATLGSPLKMRCLRFSYR